MHAKKARDRLIRLASSRPAWVLGFEDETWWSRFAQPQLHRWTAAERPVRLVAQVQRSEDPDRNALACYGLLVRWLAETGHPQAQLWLRCVDGRPVSAITIQFLEWCCEKLLVLGKQVLALVWDHVSWHTRQRVRSWIRAHNRQVKRQGQGVRIVVCPLPIKSPWLNRIEPKWRHDKRCVSEPDRTLSSQELADRICATFGCPHEEHLSIPEYVA